MVFPGRFSTGCIRCRQRKIKVRSRSTVLDVSTIADRFKCDETKPTCNRCYVHGLPCPGYTDQFSFRQPLKGSSFKSSKAASPGLSRSKSSNSPQHGKTNDNGNGRAWELARLVHSQNTRLIRFPIMDLCDDDRASLSYFIHRFVARNRADSYPSNMTCLPSILTHDGHGLLEVTTLSVAQMAAYNQLGCDRLRVQSYRNYGRAIGMLQDTISSGQGVTDDKVLAAVLLLCTFKDISGEGFGDPSEHASGLYFLLETRGLEQLATGRGFELYVLSLLRLHVYSFLHDDDTYSDPGGMEHFLGLFDPLMRAMSLTTEMLHLRHALVRSTRGMQQFTETLSPCTHEDGLDARLLEESFQTLYKFDDWDEEAPVYWRNTFEGRTVPIALGRVATGSHYYDPETACTIILIRLSRLILLISVLEYLEARVQQHVRRECAVGGGWADYLPALEHDVRVTIDDMLSCVPYALDEVDTSGRPVPTPNDGAGALIILQPLKVIISCQRATSQQLLVCESFLARMNRAIGIKSAAVLKEQASLTIDTTEIRSLVT
ncbi:c6 transcription [Fusarium tjaetaba]|uniref:C6 transcription n=1 Tax=Fusarium tjaetaba TaxID=1567544 RepID=A0A8H5W6D6_9HYPO|nr:c6 transcription [Fusarium tjaetaba]KAF5650807.1 c6 transcription [Fusarium tjaetaba]